MYTLTQKDLIANGEIVASWTPDYQEFDVDLNEAMQQALVDYEGNYYIAEYNSETNEALFPDEEVLVLDIDYERLNNTYIWNQIHEYIPDEELPDWDAEGDYDDEDWEWEIDNE
jgi:hypothetical protein